MWQWIAQNRQWLFSGVAISVIGVAVWLLKKLFQRHDAPPKLNINVSPTISPVISPTVSLTQSNVQTATGHNILRPGAQPTPDVKPVNFKAVFARGMGAAGMNCFVVSFRNDGLADAMSIIANIGYVGSTGQRMLVDYGAWIGHMPTIDIHRGHTKNLIVAVTDEDRKNFAVTDIAPATNYTTFRVEEVGEISPGDWRVIVTLNGENFKKDYAFTLTVTNDGRMLAVPSDGTETPERKKETPMLPNVGCLRPELTIVAFDEETDVWSKTNGDGFPAAIVPFSNDPRPPKKILPVDGLRARLTYYKREAIEEFRRVDSGCWLDEAYRSIYLDVGGIVYLMVALQISGQTGVVTNPRHSAARYSEDHTFVDPLPHGNYEVKVDLVGGVHGDYAETYWFQLDVGEGLGLRRINQRPSRMS